MCTDSRQQSLQAGVHRTGGAAQAHLHSKQHTRCCHGSVNRSCIRFKGDGLQNHFRVERAVLLATLGKAICCPQ